MAAGERNKNGHATDFVKHLAVDYDTPNEHVFCGRKNYGYRTTDLSDITCINCLNKLQNQANKSIHLKNALIKSRAKIN